ncbi:hypothetical protein [Mycolicibacterium sp.]|uniref:hypothetical protein n=1 Tax=Mycolicibacterium sp. TaxID=2320850 RepID=UPI003D0ED2B3
MIPQPQPIGVGDFPAALVLVAGGDTGAERYNRWLADPASDSVDGVRAGLGAYADLADLVGYLVGMCDDLPTPTENTPPELAALLLSAQAGAAVEADPPAAVTLLRRAATRCAGTAPHLAGTLLGTAGTLAAHHDLPGSRDDLETALELLDGAGLPATMAELHHALGGVEHAEALAADRPLQQAMRHYYAGLRLISEEDHPLVWAGLQLDLATAQLATPMKQATDQLRIGVAAQALRACRRVFTVDEHPVPWSTATLNLANALVYLPSTHREDNLREAAQLYEEILVSGVRDDDAPGRARVLCNQGNALAHLGVFDRATAVLAEARFLFETALDHDGVLTVRQILDEIAKATVGFDAEREAAGAARQSEKMGRVDPGGTGRTAGMGVTPRPPEAAQKRATVTVVAHRDRP